MTLVKNKDQAKKKMKQEENHDIALVNMKK